MKVEPPRLAPALGFAKASATYAGAALIGPGINFLALPIYTRVLSTEDFGILSLLQATIGVLSVLIGLSPQVYLTSQYAALDVRQRAEALGAMFLVLVVGTGLGLTGLFVSGAVWPELNLAPWLVVLTGLRAMSTVVLTIATNLYIIRRQPGAFALWTIVPVVLSVASGLLATAYLAWGWKGRFVAECIAIVGSSVVWFGRSWREWAPFLTRLPRERLLPYLRFSFPLVVHGLGFWAIASQDRFFVGSMIGVQAAGVYAVAYSIGNVVEVAHLGVHRALLANFYERARDPKQHGHLVKVGTVYLGASIVALMAFAIVVPPLVPLFAGQRFAESAALIPWLAVGATFSAARNYLAGFLFVASRTGAVMWISVGGALCNAALNWLWLPSMGIRGAAIATAVAYGCMTLATGALAALVRRHDASSSTASA